MSWKSGVVVSHIGERFGKLVILETFQRQQSSGRNVRYCRCRCDCGIEKTISLDHLLTGHTISCGCVHKEMLQKRLTLHNQTNTRLHHIWEGIRHRCNCKTYKRYEDYGGRGIKLCEEWNDFCNFKKWADENGYSENLTIDRIDNNGNYEPSNCRLVDNLVQQNNKRNNRYYEVNGEKLTCGQIARKYGVEMYSLKYFLKKESNVIEAIRKSKRSKE